MSLRWESLEFPPPKETLYWNYSLIGCSASAMSEMSQNSHIYSFDFTRLIEIGSLSDCIDYAQSSSGVWKLTFDVSTSIHFKTCVEQNVTRLLPRLNFNSYTIILAVVIKLGIREEEGWIYRWPNNAKFLYTIVRLLDFDHFVKMGSTSFLALKWILLFWTNLGR